MMKPDDKIFKGTIVRMMDEKLYRVLGDTLARSRVLMIHVNEDYSIASYAKKRYYFLLLDKHYGEGEDRQSILYEPPSKEKIEFLSREPISRFELMEL